MSLKRKASEPVEDSKIPLLMVKARLEELEMNSEGREGQLITYQRN